MTSATDRAKAQHWDVTPCPRDEQNLRGKQIAAIIRDWNAEAIKRAGEIGLTGRILDA